MSSWSSWPQRFNDYRTTPKGQSWWGLGFLTLSVCLHALPQSLAFLFPQPRFSYCPVGPWGDVLQINCWASICSFPETAWDLGLFAAKLAPGLTSPWATRYRESVRDWKITVCPRSLGKFWTEICKGQKNPMPCLKSQEQNTGCWEQKKQYCACLLRWTPPKEWANHLSQPSSLTPGRTPTLTAHEKQSGLTLGSKQEQLLSAAAAAPGKPCLNFLSGLWSISVYCGRPRILVSSQSSSKTSPWVSRWTLLCQVTLSPSGCPRSLLEHAGGGRGCPLPDGLHCPPKTPPIPPFLRWRELCWSTSNSACSRNWQ